MKFNIGDYVWVSEANTKYVGTVCSINITASGNYYSVSFISDVPAKPYEENLLNSVTVTFANV